jgi:hypothetical protein
MLGTGGGCVADGVDNDDDDDDDGDDDDEEPLVLPIGSIVTSLIWPPSAATPIPAPTL